MQMQDAPNNIPTPRPPASDEHLSLHTCFDDINHILSKDMCFDSSTAGNSITNGVSISHRIRDRKRLHPSFWENDNVASCINEDYELVGITYAGIHIFVGAQPILGHNYDHQPSHPCPIVAVDAAWGDPTVRGEIYKHATLIEDEFSEDEKKNSYLFRNRMTLKDFRDAVENANISSSDFADSSAYDFLDNNCATFPLDILSELGIDFKGEHREAVTSLILRGLLSTKETVSVVMDIVREKLRGRIGGTIWASLKTFSSEKDIFLYIISSYIDSHNKSTRK